MTHPLGPADPARIGPYVLSGVLGAGGQGVVYLGRDASGSGDEVAVKVAQFGLARDPDARRLFLREGQAAQRVAPFCTARVLDVGVHEERPYIVSEYVPGLSLFELVRTRGPRRGGGLHRLAVATLTALDAIHRAGLIHRDLKPANVIMGPEGPVVIDFGIARAFDSATTRSGLIGTPSFMAPELFDGQAAGPASDVFAWGVTMVYAATGANPFHFDTMPAVLRAILTLDPDLSAVPEEMRGLLAGCLAKDPSGRPYVGTLLTALTRGAHETPRLPDPNPTRLAPTIPAPRPTAVMRPAPDGPVRPRRPLVPPGRPRPKPAPVAEDFPAWLEKVPIPLRGCGGAAGLVAGFLVVLFVLVLLRWALSG